MFALIIPLSEYNILISYSGYNLNLEFDLHSLFIINHNINQLLLVLINFHSFLSAA